MSHPSDYLQFNSMADRNSSNYEEEEEEYSVINCDLPKDVVMQILLGLPVRSLLRFRSVCKSWYNFLKTPYFMKLHLNHQISLPPAIIFYQKMHVSCFCPDLFVLNLNPVKCNIEQYNFTINQQLPLPFAFDEAKDWANISICYNGLICLIKDIYSSPVVILWNPANRKYKCINIPSKCSRYTYLRFCFHQQSNEYKILKVPYETPMSFDDSTKMAWVYTLSSGSWKTVPFTLLSQTVAWGPQISVNGFVYWLATGSRVEYIICFDMINDEFKLMDVPDDRGFDHQQVRRTLMVLRGLLAMMVSVEDGSTDNEIWTLVNESSGFQPFSWTKKFILEPFTKETTPLGMWIDDKLLVVVIQARALKQVYSYDLVTRKIEYFHLPKEQDLASFASVRWFYFESLELEDGYALRRY